MFHEKTLLDRLPGGAGWRNLQELKFNGCGMSGSAPLAAVCVPLTERQQQDYSDLMARVKTLYAAGRHEEAKRVSTVAANIVRTGAPALE